MALTFLIDGVDRTALVLPDSLSISDELNARNTASFTLRDLSGLYRPDVGDTVIITSGAGTRLFAGTVEDPEELTPPGTTSLEVRVNCVDFNQIADRFLVAKVYETPGQTLGDIARDIVANWLSADGVTTNNVQDGPQIIKDVINYIYATEAFNELATMTGYAWNIDYYKDLHFFARDTNYAPFSLNDTSGNFRNMKVKKTRSQYRNRQYLRAGFDQTSQRTESFKGDGKNKTFSLAYPVATVPTIKVNGTTKTVGIRAVDSGKDFYWNKGSNEITQDDAGVALVSTDTLDVTYVGLYPIIVVSQDDGEIASRMAAEGGTGIYEAIEQDQNIDDGDLALAKSGSLLRRYGKIPRIVTFETDDEGLAAGQLIPINVSRHNLSGEFLIQSVRAKDIGGMFVRYTAVALDGEAIGGWTTFFQKLARETRTFVIRENEVLMTLRSFTDTVVLADALTFQTQAPMSLSIGETFCTDSKQYAEVLS